MLTTVVGMYGCHRWQTDGLFVLTGGAIHWISWLSSIGMLGAGVELLMLPTELRQ